MKKWHTAAACTLLTVAALTGCAGSEGVVTREQDSATNTPTVDPSESAATTSASPTPRESSATKTPSVTPPPSGSPHPTGTETSEGPEVATFGENFVYNDGLRLSIVRVESDTLSRTGCCRKPGSPIAVFTFKLNNGTDDVYDPVFFSVKVTYGKVGKSAEQVFDSARDIGGGFERKLLPGRVAVFDYAYSVPTPGMDDVVVQVDVDFEHSSVFFQDSVD